MNTSSELTIKAIWLISLCFGISNCMMPKKDSTKEGESMASHLATHIIKERYLGCHVVVATNSELEESDLLSFLKK